MEKNLRFLKIKLVNRSSILYCFGRVNKLKEMLKKIEELLYLLDNITMVLLSCELLLSIFFRFGTNLVTLHLATCLWQSN